jgi:osmoprotectant transport system ATP-binding protein
MFDIAAPFADLLQPNGPCLRIRGGAERIRGGWRTSKMHVDQPSDFAVEFRDAGYRVHHDGRHVGTVLVHALNLQVRRGETLVLLGRSGSGKTTTLKMINLLLAPTEGSVLIQGRPSMEWDLIKLRRGIGYAIQETGLFPHFTVERNIGLVPAIEGWPKERVQARVSELLTLVGLEQQVASRYPSELSGGQRQRVGVARALAADPPILLMDEPFGALDAITRAELQREFLGLQRRLRKTIIFVTHDLREALLLGTRIALLEAGRLVATYTPEEFVNSKEPMAAAYVAAFRTAENSSGGGT